MQVSINVIGWIKHIVSNSLDYRVTIYIYIYWKQSSTAVNVIDILRSHGGSSVSRDVNSDRVRD